MDHPKNLCCGQDAAKLIAILLVNMSVGQNVLNLGPSKYFQLVVDSKPIVFQV